MWSRLKVKKEKAKAQCFRESLQFPLEPTQLKINFRNQHCNDVKKKITVSELKGIVKP